MKLYKKKNIDYQNLYEELNYVNEILQDKLEK